MWYRITHLGKRKNGRSYTAGIEGRVQDPLGGWGRRAAVSWVEISRTGGYALADHFVEIVELNFFLCCTLSSVRVIFSKKQGNTNETQQEKQKNNF